jgi:TPR repeat protein
MSVPGIQEFRDQNYDEALPLLMASAHSGDAEAQCLLGNIYQLGLGETTVNQDAAMQWYYLAADQGYSVATNNLAGMLWPISREAASAMYQLAKQQGFIHAPAALSA